MHFYNCACTFTINRCTFTIVRALLRKVRALLQLCVHFLETFCTLIPLKLTARHTDSDIPWVSMQVNKSEIYTFNICVPFLKLSDDNCSIE